MNEISWCTIMMFSASIPSYKKKKETEENKPQDGENISVIELSKLLK